MSEYVADTSTAIATKLTPSIGVSLATIGGYPVSDLVLWVTLIYTVMLAGHKLWHICRDIKRGSVSE